MPKKFYTEIREIFNKPYLKVKLLDTTQLKIVKNLIETSSSVHRCNVSQPTNDLTIYPNQFYSATETQTEVEKLLTGYFDGSILSVTTRPQCATIQTSLSPYQEAKQLYDKAIEGINVGRDYRHALDDLRLALETLLKNVLGNEKSLENQQDAIASYLGRKGVSNEIVGNVRVNLSGIARYFNEHEKHKNDIRTNEIDYIVTQANNIINIIL